MHLTPQGAAPRTVRPARAVSRARPRDRRTVLVLALISERYRVPVRLLLHRSRCIAPVARARQLAMYLCNVALGRPMALVARDFGRDRTTIAHACRKFEDLRDDAAIDAELATLEAEIETLADPEAGHDPR